MASKRKTPRNKRESDFWEWELVWEARSLNVGEATDPICVVCVTCSLEDLFLARKVFDTQPTPSALWEVLIEAMHHPETGKPRRPKRLMVQGKQGWKRLKARLRDVGINLMIKKELEYPDGFPEWINEVRLNRESRRGFPGSRQQP